MPHIANYLSAAALTALLTATTASSAHAEIVTLKDVAGHDVKLDVPAKKIVLGLYFEDYWATSVWNEAHRLGFATNSLALNGFEPSTKDPYALSI